MNKQELIDSLRKARATFLASIDGLTDEQQRMPGAAGIWSIKDIMGHLTAWESEVVTALNSVQNKRVPSILDIEDFHEYNVEIYHDNASRPQELIRADFEGVHRMLIQMIADFDDRELFSRTKYRFMEGEPLAILIEDYAILHEEEHAEDIQAWRESQGF